MWVFACVMCACTLLVRCLHTHCVAWARARTCTPPSLHCAAYVASTGDVPIYLYIERERYMYVYTNLYPSAQGSFLLLPTGTTGCSCPHRCRH